MAQPRRVLRIIGKFLAYAVGLVIVILTIAHFAWKYSGSNEWKLWRDKKGVAVYTLKKPGATRLQFKVVTRINTTMDRIVAALTDTSSEGCNNWIDGCTAGKIIKPFDEQSLNYVQAFHVDVSKYTSLAKDLQFVNKVQFKRDARTKRLVATVEAMPELLPHDPCCNRMTEMHNVWQFTPLENGMIEFIYIENDDPHIPYVLYNRMIPINMTWMRRTAEKVFNSEKYRNAQFAFLREP
jgi:hypothetical protein